jgi:hypothetical protein
MNIRQLSAPVIIAALTLASPAAFAQMPETKLARNLSEATVNAVWCSALMLEESYYYEEASEDAIYWEDMAYDLGEDLDEVMGEAGLPMVESEEIWAIFDSAAEDYAATDEDAYMAELEACEDAYNGNKIKLR